MFPFDSFTQAQRYVAAWGVRAGLIGERAVARPGSLRQLGGHHGRPCWFDPGSHLFLPPPRLRWDRRVIGPCWAYYSLPLPWPDGLK